MASAAKRRVVAAKARGEKKYGEVRIIVGQARLLGRNAALNWQCINALDRNKVPAFTPYCGRFVDLYRVADQAGCPHSAVMRGEVSGSMIVNSKSLSP